MVNGLSNQGEIIRFLVNRTGCCFVKISFSFFFLFSGEEILQRRVRNSEFQSIFLQYCSTLGPQHFLVNMAYEKKIKTSGV